MIRIAIVFLALVFVGGCAAGAGQYYKSHDARGCSIC